MDNLATVVESMIQANKSLRLVIESSANEKGQLEQFEDHFRSARERFSQFKQTVLSNNNQADELILRLEQTLHEKRRTAEDVRRQIAVLRHERKLQDEENQGLEKALDDIVDCLKTINTNGNSITNTYANGNSLGGGGGGGGGGPPRGKIIDRLREDMAK